jgi:uncharacterized repeat protein (TIGR02543 family)
MGVAAWGGHWCRNQYFRNNIFYDSRWCVWQPTGANFNDFDYDCVYNGGNTEFWYWNTTNYQNIASVQSSLGVVVHGISANPLFVAPASGDLSLQPTSPCIDKGVLLPGFNDANSPWPYKGSAPDMGCFEYPTYRLSVDVTPPGTTIIRGNGWYIDGTLVSIGPAPEAIPGNTGTRHSFSRWIVDGVERTGNPITITMDSPHQAVAQYETQHYLNVNSEYGNPQGSGWYFSDSTAEFSVPATVGVIIQHHFAGWSGDSTAATPAASIIMDEPRTLTANWRSDYSRLCIVIGILAVFIGVTSIVVARRRKKLPSL